MAKVKIRKKEVDGRKADRRKGIDDAKHRQSGGASVRSLVDRSKKTDHQKQWDSYAEKMMKREIRNYWGGIFFGLVVAILGLVWFALEAGLIARVPIGPLLMILFGILIVIGFFSTRNYLW